MFDINSINLSEEEAQSILDRCSWCADDVDKAAELEDYGCVWDGDGAALYSKAYWTVHKQYDFGVCDGRHEIPVTEFIFDEIENPCAYIDMYRTAWYKIPENAELVNLYITGLTPATLAIVAVCAARNIKLIAYNYDRDSGKYKPQVVLK